MIIYTFPLIFCCNLDDISFQICFLLKIEDFLFFDPQMPKNCNIVKKRSFKFNSGFNNQQNLMIFCLVTIYESENHVEAGSLNFDFFSRFCHFLAQRLAKVEKKINCLLFRGHKVQK